MPQEEEEERIREEEERQKKEDTERRKAERLERRAQLKREGKLLTGKAKKEAERLAAVREQFLKQAGIEDPTGKPPALLCYHHCLLQSLSILLLALTAIIVVGLAAARQSQEGR